MNIIYITLSFVVLDLCPFCFKNCENMRFINQYLKYLHRFKLTKFVLKIIKNKKCKNHINITMKFLITELLNHCKKLCVCVRKTDRQTDRQSVSLEN